MPTRRIRLPRPRWEATRAVPGTEEKVRVFAERIERGLPLFHPSDARVLPDGRVLMPPRPTAGQDGARGRGLLPRGVKRKRRGFQARPILPGLGRVYLGSYRCPSEAGRAVAAADRVARLAAGG